MSDDRTAEEKLAQAAGALFYTLPSELKVNEAIDPLLRVAVAAINSSGWIWTAESCQGHPDDADLHSAWGHNTNPYLRLVCRAELLGDAVATMLAEAGDEESAMIGAPELRLRTRALRDGWIEIQVYVTAHNVATRNRGCQALERFGFAIQQRVPAPPAVTPAAWRRLIDSPYEKHPRWIYTDQPPTVEPTKWEALYAQPAVETPASHGPLCVCPSCYAQHPENTRPSSSEEASR